MNASRLLLTAPLIAFLGSCCDNGPYAVMLDGKEETEVAVKGGTMEEVALTQPAAPNEVQDVTEPKVMEEAKPETPSFETGMNIIAETLPDQAKSFLPVTKKIHALLKKDEVTKMKPYTETAPAAGGATFDLVPIPGGEFQIGSPDGEKGRGKDEAPQKTVKIEPFWMATTETTWALYRNFMENGKGRNKDGTLNTDGNLKTSEPPFEKSPPLLDAISQPTPPYMPMHFGLADSAGYDPKYPAIAMTQHAASKFCEWLSAQTGHYYRLPTEAEWEYACRAGTTTAYSFGDDPAKLGDYAWYFENSEMSYQPVGKKKANPWGLFDMHGNVSEWTLSSYHETYSGYQDGVLNPLTLTQQRYPRVTRGGHWDADAIDLRSAKRAPSKQAWKMIDPQDPKSLWYHTNTQWLGFRVIRPAKVPSVEEMHLLWNTGPGKRF